MYILVFGLNLTVFATRMLLNEDNALEPRTFFSGSESSIAWPSNCNPRVFWYDDFPASLHYGRYAVIDVLTTKKEILFKATYHNYWGFALYAPTATVSVTKPNIVKE